MSKAEELLRKAMTRLRLAPIETDSERHELMDEIYDYLNRKDKLVKGSEWVCDVDCIGSKMSYSPYDDETVFVVDVRDFVTLKYFIYDNAHEDDMPLEQFLACFSPVEKENE